ncbi:hypothetical protein [Nocardioides psychrotolerans]|uniref:hypothetical protein n=1 Tax=Nocardioides psychrotolerans TaxID=1005945 RepID=UPI0031384008
MTLRPLTLSAAALTAVLALGACSGAADEDAAPVDAPSTQATETPSASPSAPAATDQPTEAPTSEAPVEADLAIVIAGDEVSPNAVEISVGRGEPVLISFDTDRGGELHVHSKPEQYVEFEAGTSQQELVIEVPGQVEVEDHDTGDVVAVISVT